MLCIRYIACMWAVVGAAAQMCAQAVHTNRSTRERSRQRDACMDVLPTLFPKCVYMHSSSWKGIARLGYGVSEGAHVDITATIAPTR